MRGGGDSDEITTKERILMPKSKRQELLANIRVAAASGLVCSVVVLLLAFWLQRARTVVKSN